MSVNAPSNKLIICEQSIKIPRQPGTNYYDKFQTAAITFKNYGTKVITNAPKDTDINCNISVLL